MVLDTSALVAILRNEQERPAFVEAIEIASARRLSAATLVETAMVIEARRGPEGVRDLDHFLAAAHVELVPVDAEQAHAARRAFSQFGKGRHRAGLNFGDCFSYALARTAGESLLCKGDDFIHTDVDVWQEHAGNDG